MIEILPIKLLTDQDSLIFGTLSVSLGKLARLQFPVGPGVAVSAPEFKLKTVLEHYDFGKKEVFEQSLILVKKELTSIPVPEILQKETKKYKKFFLNGETISGQHKLWQKLLHIWLGEIKSRLWKEGFYPGICQNLTSQAVIFVKDVESHGIVFFDPWQDDSVINIQFGKLHPIDAKKLDEIVRLADKKLFIPHEYEWIYDHGIKLVGLKPYTPVSPAVQPKSTDPQESAAKVETKSTVKVILDLSTGYTIQENVDGIYIASEKIYDLNKPLESFDKLIFKIVEAAQTYAHFPVFVKLADISEGMGQVRGTLRLLHQKSLLNPLIEALDFVRHKKGLGNVQIVVPFVRSVSEFLQIKRELAVKNLTRKNSLQIWLEAQVPENLLNLADYLETGLDGIIINCDELISYLNGFDHTNQQLLIYKKQTLGLIKFLEDGVRMLHKSKVPFISLGNLNLYPQVLDFLIEKGVYGIILEKYETPSARQLLHQAEKRLILKRG